MKTANLQVRTEPEACPPPLWRRAQEWLAPALVSGSVAVDATCGNGGDTSFLAGLLGSTGTVIGIDFQGDAIRQTEARLREDGLEASLLKADHADLDEILSEMGIGKVDAGIFNLGYLPGGDHTKVTRPESTCSALGALLHRASASFRLSVVAYRGHPGGKEEAEAVAEFLLHNLPTGCEMRRESGRNPDIGPVFFGISRNSNPSSQ